MSEFTTLGVTPYRAMPPRVPIPNTSALFRENTQLPRVLARTMNERASRDALSVLSVGSSFGAEADSVLALLERSFSGSVVTLTGVDVNPHIITRAQDAKHRINKYRSPADEPALRSSLPTSLGELSWTKLEDSYGNPEYRWVLDTGGIRARHNVHFLCVDLVQDPDQVPPADLVLCNNVLFHLSEVERDPLVDAMCAKLKPGGVLGMEEAATTGENYMPWRQALGSRLANKGMRPILADVRTDVPLAFQKP